MHFVLTPAYGRDYTSKTEARKDFMADKDFIHASRMHTGGGTYINRADIPTGATVEIRYDKLRKLVVLKRGFE